MVDPNESPVRDVEWRQDVAIVSVEGEVDLTRSLRFQRDLSELLEQEPRVLVIDLKDVTYMDSSGVASLVKILSSVRKAGRTLRLASPGHRVRSILEITRLDKVFEIYPTVDEASEAS